MILSGKQIAREVENGTIRIDPFDPNHINPASYDLTLGDTVVEYTWPGHDDVYDVSVYDVSMEPRVNRWPIDSSGFILRPGRGYLMHTRERIWTATRVPVLDGKSSIGRLFVSVHQTAGYGDPGFDGQYTLEVTTVYPVRLYAGMRIAQIRFHTMLGDVETYAGKYVGEAAQGPVPSRAWRSCR